MNGDFLTIAQGFLITGYCEEAFEIINPGGKLKSVKPNGGRILSRKI